MKMLSLRINTPWALSLSRKKCGDAQNLQETEERTEEKWNTAHFILAVYLSEDVSLKFKWFILKNMKCSAVSCVVFNWARSTQRLSVTETLCPTQCCYVHRVGHYLTSERAVGAVRHWKTFSFHFKDELQKTKKKPKCIVFDRLYAG